ncbi:MAG: LytR C-terminal domain-containing protein [Bacteroidota bacterium]|jgi:hypothetical protein
MNRPSQKSIFLSAIILLLAVFIVYQVYGIVSASRNSGTADQRSGDSTVVPVQIDVLNGCGVNGVGNAMTNFCRAAGYDVVEMGNYKNFDLEESMVIDRTGKLEASKMLAKRLGISQKNVIQQFSNEHPVTASVVIGKDYKTLLPWKK